MLSAAVGLDARLGLMLLLLAGVVASFSFRLRVLRRDSEAHEWSSFPLSLWALAEGIALCVGAFVLLGTAWWVIALVVLSAPFYIGPLVLRLSGK